MLKIIAKRSAIGEISEEPLGSRPGKGTRDYIMNLKWYSRRTEREVVMCFFKLLTTQKRLT